MLNSRKCLGILVLFYFTFFCCSGVFGQQTITWSELETEVGNPIDPQDVIVVEPGDTLIINLDCDEERQLQAKGILIYGVFKVENANGSLACLQSQLNVDWILGVHGSLFEVGSEMHPFDGKFELLINSSKAEAITLEKVINESQGYISTSFLTSTETHSRMPSPSDLESMIGDENYSFIMAMGANARISLHSSSSNVKKAWVQLAETAESGSTSITLSESTNWQTGDRIAIASTDFDMNQAEDFTITNTSQNGTVITIDRPLSYMHYGRIDTYSNGERSWDLDMRAEVGLLSRNITLKGDTGFDEDVLPNAQVNQFGGHVMITDGAAIHADGIEFMYMGQAGLLGRYPVHWHMLIDAEGQYIKNSSFHHTFNKGLTIHGTHNTLVENNVVYETIGHSYFLEDGSEVGNKLIQNLAINARPPLNKADETPNSGDFGETANYWIENANNTFTDNHAAGSNVYGFAFSMRGLNGASGRNPYDDIFEPIESREGPLDFTGNVAHTAHDRTFILNHAEYVQSESYKGTDEQPQVVNEFWKVEDFTAYKTGLGLYVRGIGGIFDNCVIAEVSDGTRFRLNQTLNNSLVVGRSMNLGTPSTNAEVAQGRSLPGDERFIGHQLYDGPGGLHNVHFYGFTGEDDYAMKESNAVHKSTMHYINKVTFDAAIPEAHKLRYSSTVIESRALVDLDGSLTGVAGSKLVSELNSSNDLYRSEDAYVNDDWKAIIHPPNIIAGSLRFRGDFLDDVPSSQNPTINGHAEADNNNEFTSQVEISKSNGASVDGLDLHHSVRNQSLFMIDDGYEYKLSFTNAPANFQFYVNDLPLGISIIYEIEGLSPVLTRFYKDDGLNTPLPVVESLNDLQASSQTSIYRDNNTGSIFIKFTPELRHGWLFPQPHMSQNNMLLGGNLVNVVLCKESITLDIDSSPLEGFYEANQEITLSGNLDISDHHDVFLKAPVIRIENQLKTTIENNILVEADGCQ